jgi:2-dehydro-3-deoxygluconokinase
MNAAGMLEVMLRFDPGSGRVRTARSFTVWEGGGEYNVARALRKCFGLRTALVSALVDNEVGHLVEDLILTGGVDMSHVKWVPYDGLGRTSRVGLNFTEKGYGIRPALGTSDRGHTAASQLHPGDIDWNRLFGEEGVRWFHTGGIFAALSASTPEVVIEAITAAKQHGTVVSYDLNYRPSLWESHGGSDRAVEVNRTIAPMVDVMIGNEEDFTASLGFAVEGVDGSLSQLDPTAFGRMIASVVDQYPNFKVVATTLRNAKTATLNDWSAVLFADGELHAARQREDLEIFDRVGGGDGFASGMAFAFLAGKTPAEAVEYGATQVIR